MLKYNMTMLEVMKSPTQCPGCEYKTQDAANYRKHHRRFPSHVLRKGNCLSDS